MFNIKALWWTLLGFWIAGCVYWHICKIEQFCDVMPDTQVVPAESPAQHGQLLFPLRDLGLPGQQIEIPHFWQYVIMVVVTLLLGFLLGTSYGMKKTRGLRYKLNRISRELGYYQTKQ